MPGGNSACAVPNDPPWYDDDDPYCPFPVPDPPQGPGAPDYPDPHLEYIYNLGVPPGSQPVPANEAVVRDFIELVWNWNSGGAPFIGGQVLAIVDPDYVRWRECKIGHGLARLLLAVIDTRRRVPGLHIEIDRMESHADKVFAYLTVADGEGGEMPSQAVYRVVDGMITHSWTWYPAGEALGHFEEEGS